MKIISKELMQQLRHDVPDIPNDVVALNLTLEDETTGEFNIRFYPNNLDERLETIAAFVRGLEEKHQRSLEVEKVRM